MVFRNNGFEVQKRAQVLGLLTRSHKGLCVAGTHGKTTTSTMCAHIIVALVLQVYYNLILSKIDHLTCQMEESVISLLDIIARHKGGQA